MHEKLESKMRHRMPMAGLTMASVLLVPPAYGHSASYSENTLYAFCTAKHCTDGSGPTGTLTIDSTGDLFGTTNSGGTYGTHNDGVVFEFVPGTGQCAVVYSFCSQTFCSDGWQPGHVKLVIDTAGNLYGTTSKGGNSNNAGVAFELIHNQSSWQEQILYSFCTKRRCRDGADPRDGLTYAGAASGQPYDGTSPLYGTTFGGGANGHGTVFSLKPKNGGEKWSERVVYSFCSQSNCSDGETPDTPLYLDTAGNFYGTTQLGGANNGGEVFEVTPTGSKYAELVLYSFCAHPSCADGEEPEGGVIMDTGGNLYGTTASGGASGDGVVFELVYGGSQWQYNVLDNFAGSNGKDPAGALIIDGNGDLFGTTYSGGIGNRGTVFEFLGSIHTLYSFCPQKKDCSDGRSPIAGVIEDTSGNLFGVASSERANKGGTLFEVSPVASETDWGTTRASLEIH